MEATTRGSGRMERDASSSRRSSSRVVCQGCISCGILFSLDGQTPGETERGREEEARGQSKGTRRENVPRRIKEEEWRSFGRFFCGQMPPRKRPEYVRYKREGFSPSFSFLSPVVPFVSSPFTTLIDGDSLRFDGGGDGGDGSRGGVGED